MNKIQEKSFSLNIFDFAKSGHINPSPDFVALTNLDMMQIYLDTMCVATKSILHLFCLMCT